MSTRCDDLLAWIDDLAADARGVEDLHRTGPGTEAPGLYAGWETWDPFAILPGPAPAAGVVTVEPPQTPATAPQTPPHHVPLWLPQHVILGGPGTPRLSSTDLLLYLHLTAVRDNERLSHRLNVTHAARRCGLDRDTVSKCLKRLAAAGLVEVREEGRVGKGPLLHVARPDPKRRFNIPRALVWPVQSGSPRWGKRTPKALQTVLAILAAVDGFDGGSTKRSAASIAKSAGMTEKGYRAGLALLFGPGVAGGVLRVDGELHRDPDDQVTTVVRSTPGGWLTSEPLRTPRKGDDGSRYLVQATSRLTVDWARLPAQRPNVVDAVAETKMPDSGGSELAQSEMPESGESGVPESRESEMPESGGTRSTGTPVRQLPEGSDALLLHGRGAAAADDRAAGDNREEAEDASDNNKINSPTLGSGHSLTPGRRSQAKSKAAEDGANPSRPGMSSGGTASTLLDRLVTARSQSAAKAIITEAAATVGGLHALSIDDQVAVVHAYVRYAPADRRFALDPIDTNKVSTGLRRVLQSGIGPVALGEAITTDSNRVDSPVAVLLARIKQVEPVLRENPGSVVAEADSRLWPEHRPCAGAASTTRGRGRGVDGPVTAEGYRRSMVD